MYFGNNLSFLRTKKRLTQTDMSNILGVSQGTIANYEKRTRKPDIQAIIGIAQFFEVSIDDLLTKDLRPAGALIGRNLRYLRKRESYTQTDMAKLLNVTPKCISFYESEERKPTVEGLLNLSGFFGVTVDDLLKKDLSKAGDEYADSSNNG